MDWIDLAKDSDSLESKRVISYAAVRCYTLLTQLNLNLVTRFLDLAAEMYQYSLRMAP